MAMPATGRAAEVLELLLQPEAQRHFAGAFIEFRVLFA